MSIHPDKLEAMREAELERRLTLRQKLARAVPGATQLRIMGLALAWTAGWLCLVAGIGVALDGMVLEFGMSPRYMFEVKLGRDLGIAAWLAGTGVYLLALGGLAPALEIGRMGIGWFPPKDWLSDREEVER